MKTTEEIIQYIPTNKDYILIVFDDKEFDLYSNKSKEECIEEFKYAVERFSRPVPHNKICKN